MLIFSQNLGVSHSHERTEKICLNCQAALYGRYCHICGQENIDTRESLWSLLSHFFNDITHFDGRFYTTLGKLVKKPGFLSKEYVSGRRARYLHPIRMYLFTSFIFFLVFYSYAANSLFVANATREIGKDSTVVLNPKDSIEFKIFGKSYAKIAPNDPTQNKTIVQNFIHSFPTLLFISLPLFAFFLKLLYSRHKYYLYADHAIFLVHLYIFTFILALVMIGVDKIAAVSHAPWINYIQYALAGVGIIYSFAAMKNFYQQGVIKTTLKFILFHLIMFITLVILFILFLMITIFRG